MICRFRQISDHPDRPGFPGRYGLRRFVAAALLCASFASHAPHAGMAQSLSMPDIPVITIEADQLFAATQFGQRLASELEARGTQLAGENRRIEAELADEESELTALRPTMDPIEFRDLADAFDARVQQVRDEQDDKGRRLSAVSDQAQRGFLLAIAPVLERMMNERGASVILDRRAVFLSADASDITAQAVARIDEALGTGQSLDDVVAAGGAAPQSSPQPGPEPAPQPAEPTTPATDE